MEATQARELPVEQVPVPHYFMLARSRAGTSNWYPVSNTCCDPRDREGVINGALTYFPDLEYEKKLIVVELPYGGT